MGQAGIYVGIDVAKAKVDVAVRPTGERWEVPRDAAGIPQLVSELKTLGPSLVLLAATGGLELPLVAARAAEALPVVVVNPRRCGTSPGLLGSWPRPTPWTPPCWPTLLRRSSPRASSARRRNPGAQLPHCPEAAGDDDAGLGAEPPRRRHQRRPSPHCGPHHLVGAGSKRP